MTTRTLAAALSCALLALGGCAAPPIEVAPPDSSAQAETPAPSPTAEAPMPVPAPVEVAPAPPPPMAATAQPNCRPITQTIVIDGQNQQAYGLACQQPDGTWQIVPPPDQTGQAMPPPGAPPGAYPAYPAYPAPAYAPYGYPYYYGYPGYFGPALGIGFVGRGWYRGGWGGRGFRRR